MFLFSFIWTLKEPNFVFFLLHLNVKRKRKCLLHLTLKDVTFEETHFCFSTFEDVKQKWPYRHSYQISAVSSLTFSPVCPSVSTSWVFLLRSIPSQFDSFKNSVSPTTVNWELRKVNKRDKPANTSTCHQKVILCQSISVCFSRFFYLHFFASAIATFQTRICCAKELKTSNVPSLLKLQAQAFTPT